MNVFLVILITSVATYLLRFVPLALLRKPLREPHVVAFIEYLPYSLLAAMVAPGIISSTGTQLSAICGTVVALAAAVAGFSLPVVVALASAAALIL